jgi:phage-related protein
MQAIRSTRPGGHTAGARPVKESLDGLSIDDKVEVVAAMADVRIEGLRVARHLRGDIYEVRAEGRRSVRILFAQQGKKGRVLLALEGFEKKTQKTPDHVVRVARRDWPSRGPTLISLTRSHRRDTRDAMTRTKRSTGPDPDFLDELSRARAVADRGRGRDGDLAVGSGPPRIRERRREDVDCGTVRGHARARGGLADRAGEQAHRRPLGSAVRREGSRSREGLDGACPRPAPSRRDALVPHSGTQFHYAEQGRRRRRRPHARRPQTAIKPAYPVARPETPPIPVSAPLPASTENPVIAPELLLSTHRNPSPSVRSRSTAPWAVDLDPRLERKRAVRGDPVAAHVRGPGVRRVGVVAVRGHHEPARGALAVREHRRDAIDRPVGPDVGEPSGSSLPAGVPPTPVTLKSVRASCRRRRSRRQILRRSGAGREGVGSLRS